jgi:hypothetical protein
MRRGFEHVLGTGFSERSAQRQIAVEEVWDLSGCTADLVLLTSFHKSSNCRFKGNSVPEKELLSDAPEGSRLLSAEAGWNDKLSNLRKGCQQKPSDF